jgi:hypothetical protein
MHCLPEDIIGCRYNLWYDISQNRMMSGGRQSQIWSSQFCRKLAALLVQPIWGGLGAAFNLAIAIQYAVIVDTDDHGPWVVNVPTWDTFLKALLDRKRVSPEQKVSDIRKQLRSESTASGNVFDQLHNVESYGSDWDHLFEALERISETRDGGEARKDGRKDPSEPFSVHVRHLEQLERALDSITHRGLPRFPLTVHDYSHGMNGEIASMDCYPRQGDLKNLRDYSILREMERVSYLEKQAAAAKDDEEAEMRVTHNDSLDDAAPSSDDDAELESLATQ